MPNGGQIAGGSGLSLQSTTPGLAERGNAHLTGAMLVEGTLGASGGMVLTTGERQQVVIVGEGCTIPFPTTNVGSNGPVAIGCFTAIGRIDKGWQSQMESVAIGNGARAHSRASTVIGWGANVDAAGARGGYQILIGRSSSITSSPTNDTGKNTLISVNGTATLCDRLIGIGFQINAGQKGNGVAPNNKSSVLIGGGIVSTAGGNQIIISSEFVGADLPNETRSHLIKIGDSSHSTIEIGGRDLSLAGQVKYIATGRIEIGNTVAETSMVGTGIGNQTLPASIWKLGRVLRLNARGVISSTGTPTLRLRYKIGASLLLDIGPVTLPAMTAGNHGWDFSADLTMLQFPTNAVDVAVNGIMRIGGSTADLSSSVQSSVPMDASADALVDLTAQWGTAHASNVLTTSQFFLEVIG